MREGGGDPNLRVEELDGPRSPVWSNRRRSAGPGGEPSLGGQLRSQSSEIQLQQGKSLCSGLPISYFPLYFVY